MTHFGHFPKTRLRRLRHHESIRELVRETRVQIKDLVLPLFIKAGISSKHPIKSMPGYFQLSLNDIKNEIEEVITLGIKSVILFGIPDKKDDEGSHSYCQNGIVQTAIKTIKSLAPNLLVISDICCCEYTNHGHCGVLSDQIDVIDNDKTLEILRKQAVSHAKAGADILAPSGNIDGMVHAIREALDQAGFSHLPILSYSAKYASTFYGPFREAAEGAPKFGNRKTYQMDFANAQESLRECALDVQEGADMLMVKPAHAYLDIISRVKHSFPSLPLGAYHTSGEFALLKAAAQQNWLNERDSVLEILTSIRRAGADFIITYYAKEAARWLSE